MADVNQTSASPPLQVRVSPVHGRGVFATRRIEKGERIIEYLGQRVSHDEADRRYEDKDENDSHTFLFIVDSKTVIDAGVDGNDARFFNHSCNPNCESVVENRRVFIEALRAIEAGEEMTYDYQLYKDEDDPENIDEVFACRCGFEQCRGTMLWPPEPKKKRRPRQKAVPVRTSARRKESVAAKKSAAGKSAVASRGRGKKSASAKKTARSEKSAAAGKSGRGPAHRGRAPSMAGRPGGGSRDGATGRSARKKARRR
jgi:hypothetical protein